jgi:hypothetical protein
MSTEQYKHVELTMDERADVVLITDTLRAAGWQVYQETTRTDETMVMEPGAGARYQAPGCKLEVEYVGMGVSIWVAGLGDREDHELIVHGCGKARLGDVLAVLIAYQDRLTVDRYREFGQQLLNACDSIEYSSGKVWEFTREDLDTGELPLLKTESA